MMVKHNLPIISMSKRPKLTLENVPEYLDWIMANLHGLNAAQVDTHLRAVELVVRMQGNQAQAKATQHTLVEDGTIAPPKPTPGLIAPPNNQKIDQDDR